MPELDRIDRKILTELQRDATLAVAQIAERVGLSQTPCWKRIQKLEGAGIITGRTALVDASKVGLGLTVYAEVEALDHTTEWREGFLDAISRVPEVMEVVRLGGASDYMLRIVVPDMNNYDRVYRQLSTEVPFRSVTSKFVMEVVHRKAALPVDLS
jgi:Lrp/AsnC family transcriptional regulator